MTFSVDVQNSYEYEVDLKQLQRAAHTVLAQHNAHPESAMTIVIANDDEVAALNHKFRGIDAPTDVLSFPADPPPVQIPDEPPYLGDLIIAYPYAAAQAQREEQALEDSLALLVIHGTLHLLSYDHDSSASREAMWAAQGAALQALNLSLDLVPALEVEHHDESTDQVF